MGHAEVFTSPDGKTWKSVKNPGLTRKDGAPLSVASADGMVALLFSGQAGGGRRHVVTSDAALTSWSAVDLAEDSPAPIVIAPFLDGLAVAGCTRVPPTVGVAWLSSSPSGQFKALDPAPQQCVNAGASSGSELALATKTGAWFLDDNLKSSELPFLTRTTGALPIIPSVIHKGDAWVFGGQEHADGNALGASDIVVWSIRH